MVAELNQWRSYCRKLCINTKRLSLKDFLIWIVWIDIDHLPISQAPHRHWRKHPLFLLDLGWFIKGYYVWTLSPIWTKFRGDPVFIRTSTIFIWFISRHHANIHGYLLLQLFPAWLILYSLITSITFINLLILRVWTKTTRSPFLVLFIANSETY